MWDIIFMCSHMVMCTDTHCWCEFMYVYASWMWRGRGAFSIILQVHPHWKRFIENRFCSHTIHPDHRFSFLHSLTLWPPMSPRTVLLHFLFREEQASKTEEPDGIKQDIIRLGKSCHTDDGPDNPTGGKHSQKQVKEFSTLRSPIKNTKLTATTFP